MGVAEENGRQKTQQARTDEPIFDLEAQPDGLFDEKEVLFSMYNAIRPEKKKTKQDEEWSLRMTCTQEWFIRCSWINKYLFIEILCSSTRGCTVLENVLKSIESILSKDMLESVSKDSTNYPYDRIPTDDNRALDPVELNRAMKDDFYWFLNLEGSYQARVIQRLIRLGGGGLILRAYQLMERMYAERQEVSKLLSIFPKPVLSKLKEGSKQKVKESSKTGMSLQSLDGKSLESDNSAMNNFHLEKLKQLARRDAELLKYKKLKRIFVEDSKSSKKGETKEAVDYLQVLPIWLNRRIMSYIDDKSLSGFKKVGKYWGKMIDESINEKSGRKAINAKINKIIGTRANKEERKIEEKSENEEFEFITELGAKELINKKNESEKALKEMSEHYCGVLSKKYKVNTLDTSYYPERCGAYDGVIGFLACSTPSNIVQFYSVKTGARLNFLVFGFESPITCLALHENRIHMFFGCRDGSLISKVIRTNKTAASFNGHTKAVISIFTTQSNLLSASMDNTIKYFQLWSGLCLLCIDLKPELNISSVLFRETEPCWTAVGTVEGVLVLVDIEGKRFLVKEKLDIEEITRLAHDGDFLITGSARGRIRVWDVNRLGINFPTLRPFYDIDVGSAVSALRFYKNQTRNPKKLNIRTKGSFCQWFRGGISPSLVFRAFKRDCGTAMHTLQDQKGEFRRTIFLPIFCGCENGTMKVISLATGKIFKTLKISSQTPVTGIDIIEDKVFVKLIIWHEKGIEIRTFSLQKSSPKKMSVGKDNRENKQKAPKETQRNKTSEMVLAGYVKNSQGLIEGTPNVYKRTTFRGMKKPLEERCCTLFALRGDHRKSRQFDTDVFTRAFNSAFASSENDFSLHTFPRFGKGNDQ